MKRLWVKLCVLIGLAFYVSGEAQFVHLVFDKHHHSYISDNHSHHQQEKKLPFSSDECPICQTLALLKIVSLDQPLLIQTLEECSFPLSDGGMVFRPTNSQYIPCSRAPPYSCV